MNKKYIKKLIAVLTVGITLSVSMLNVFAAPEEVSPNDCGNTYDLVVITDPPKEKSSTFSQNYIIQGHSLEGCKITLYWHDSQADVYKKIYNHVDYYDDFGNLATKYEEAAMEVGSSNLFMKNIELSYGKNNIMVYAEKDGSYQILKFSVTLYDSGNILDILRSITM